jgi:hypothetical protein
MDGEKRTIPVGKILNDELVEPSLPKKTENAELHNQQREIATMEQC